MRLWIPALFLANLIAGTAFADTLVMKSGENKKGKIVEEKENSYLFNSQADGAVIEIPKAEVSIVDQDPAEKKSYLNTFSAKPPSPKKYQSLSIMPEEKKAAKEAPPPAVVPAAKAEGMGSGSFMKKLEEWVMSHPEAEKYLQEWIQKFHGKDADLDKLAKVANDA